MSALKKLEDKKEKTELELCIVMAGSLCDQETAAKNLELLKEIETLYREAHRQLAELKTPMPCGHLARYAVNGEDGTQYCCMCLCASVTGTDDPKIQAKIAEIINHE